jgi:anti-sigma-K factor RskA
VSVHEKSELSALYALDALDGTELCEFETHLETCDTCRSEIADYQHVASQLVVDEKASDLTWRKIESAISAAPESVSESSPAGPAWKWIAAIAAAAALVFAGLLAVDAVNGTNLDDQNVTAAADRAANEEGSLVGDFLVEDVAVAQIVLAEDGRGYVIPSPELAPLDSERTYQLWVINTDEQVISAGVLGSDPAPATFTWTGDVAGFALTREVAGGVVSSEGDVVSVLTEF